MSSIVFNFISLSLIVFIIGWFWLSSGKVAKMKQSSITIEVKDGVYSPNKIYINKPDVVLEFLRLDPTPCSQFVIFEELDVHEELPVDKKHIVQLNKLKNGEYHFACQMNMYQGVLIVKIDREKPFLYNQANMKNKNNTV